MTSPEFADVLGPALIEALTQKGFTSLTPVQKAVLDPALAGRDLRITSQTGSGKTVAIGLAVRDLVENAPAEARGPARPRALVVAPTRELAKQVEEELSWLYAPLKVKVAAVTGGASYTDERRALASAPRIVVGTPGRLLDHLKRGSVDATQVGAIVLDEADRMLDLGFKEELEAILAFAPEDHLTHLISATFPRNVRSLADRVQKEPAHVEGTPLGAANADIDHVVHLVDPRQRLNAIINLLLANPDEQTLVFCRTRADVAELSQILGEEGFAVSSISGEMEQPARNRALAEFRRGKLRALIATDVAARGIDVQDIARVIHADPPTDPDTYTHRSGRTGRAGRKGTSSILVSPSAVQRTSILLHRSKISWRFEAIPTAADILASRDERTFTELTDDREDGSLGYEPATLALAERLAEADNVARTLARLLTKGAHGGPTEPREIKAFAPPTERGQPARALSKEPRAPGPRSQDFVLFRISWGAEQGADVRRLLPMICRRGGINGTDVGSIRVARGFSTVEIGSSVADAFAQAAAAPDERNPRVTITRDGGSSGAEHRAKPKASAAIAPHKAHEHAPKAHEHAPKAREHAPEAHQAKEPTAPKPHARPAAHHRDVTPKTPEQAAPQTLAAVRAAVEKAIAEDEEFPSAPRVPAARGSQKRVETSAPHARKGARPYQGGEARAEPTGPARRPHAPEREARHAPERGTHAPERGTHAPERRPYAPERGAKRPHAPERGPRQASSGGARRPHVSEGGASRPHPRATQRRELPAPEPSGAARGPRRHVDLSVRGQAERAQRKGDGHEGPRPTSDSATSRAKPHFSKTTHQGISPRFQARDGGQDAPRKKPRPR